MKIPRYRLEGRQTGEPWRRINAWNELQHAIEAHAVASEASGICGCPRYAYLRIVDAETKDVINLPRGTR